MTTETYQGWTNHPTWLCALWLNKDQSLQDMAQDVCRTNGEMLQEAAQSLHDMVDDMLDDQLAQGRSGFVSDILSAFLADVNWKELAQSFREED